MARLTPEEILKLSEPIEQVYSDTVDALLINMAKHFNSGHSLSTEQWEIRKLSELGQLNKESIAIIAKLTAQNPVLIQAALENAVYAATHDIEPELRKAVKAGNIDAPKEENVIASQSISQALKAYDQQALEKMNLVNTTMLESTLSQYRNIVNNTVNIERQMQAAQKTLNAAAGKVITGIESRQQALRQALSQVHKEGITGFYDRAGRKWSPEAYVNMDIRTTVHNTAIESVKLRQEDYGVDIFRVSRHSGARPLCYPYQGRYFSWNNKSGTFYDGEGKQHRYYPISSTSYGKPAGLFGINCGHHPITMIPGVSIPRDRPEQDKEKNDRVYAESQEQRRLEREIRYAKQKAAMMEAAGDKEGFEKEAVKIKEKQAAYNAFCKETGRTKRLDRTQVFEYNKSVNSKATAAAKRVKTDSATKQNDKKTSQNSKSSVSTSRRELEAQAKKAYLRVNKETLGEVEAERRFNLLVDGNTDSQLRNYIKKNSENKSVFSKSTAAKQASDNNELSPKEEQAITDYMSAKSYSLNEKLRSGEPLNTDERSWVKNLDAALEKLPDYKGTVYRSIRSDYISDMDKFELTHTPNSIITYDSYTSTSKEIYDENMDIQFEIQTKHGKDISSWNSNEQEVLHKRESAFRITKREGNTIYMEEI